MRCCILVALVLIILLCSNFIRVNQFLRVISQIGCDYKKQKYFQFVLISLFQFFILKINLFDSFLNSDILLKICAIQFSFFTFQFSNLFCLTVSFLKFVRFNSHFFYVSIIKSFFLSDRFNSQICAIQFSFFLRFNTFFRLVCQTILQFKLIMLNKDFRLEIRH